MLVSWLVKKYEYDLIIYVLIFHFYIYHVFCGPWVTRSNLLHPRRWRPQWLRLRPVCADQQLFQSNHQILVDNFLVEEVSVQEIDSFSWVEHFVELLILRIETESQFTNLKMALLSLTVNPREFVSSNVERARWDSRDAFSFSNDGGCMCTMNGFNCGVRSDLMAW